jgi:hypothetical protein
MTRHSSVDLETLVLVAALGGCGGAGTAGGDASVSDSSLTDAPASTDVISSAADATAMDATAMDGSIDAVVADAAGLDATGVDTGGGDALGPDAGGIDASVDAAIISCMLATDCPETTQVCVVFVCSLPDAGRCSDQPPLEQCADDPCAGELSCACGATLCNGYGVCSADAVHGRIICTDSDD